MTGIYINGASGKMGVNLLERIHLNNDIQICKTIDEDSLDTIIDFSNPDSTIKLLKSLCNDNYALVIGTTGFNSEQIDIIKHHAKKKRIAAGSKEKMRKPGSKGAPTAKNFKRAAKTAKKR